MNLYRVRSELNGCDRLADYLKDNFVSIGWREVGDLEGVEPAALQAELQQTYGSERPELPRIAEELGMFVYEMQDGDIVMIADGDFVYLGDLGDYYYVDSEDDDACHRRGVTWLNRGARAEFNSFVREWLDSEGLIAKFMQPIALAALDRWIGKWRETDEQKTTERTTVRVDRQTIEEALAILRQALHSDDAKRRERAAIAILQYAKN